MIADSHGSADVLVITSKDARSTGPLLVGLRAEFAQRCPGCDLRFVDVPIPSWAARIRTEVQSALVRDPKIGYVIPIYDSMSQYAVPAIKAAGRAGKTNIAAFNGTPFVLAMLADKTWSRRMRERTCRGSAGPQWTRHFGRSPACHRCPASTPRCASSTITTWPRPGTRRASIWVRERLRSRLPTAVAHRPVGRHVPALAVRSVFVSFGGVRALDGAHLVVEPGEVHGLLGANGSGKSTLVKVLAGYHAPEPGAVLEVHGEPQALPLEAGQLHALRVGFVHQELGLIESLSVAENLFLPELAFRRGRLSPAGMRTRARAILAARGVALDAAS